MLKSHVMRDVSEMNAFKKVATSGLMWMWLVAAVIVLDRISKDWVLNHLMLGEPLQILPVFNLTLAFNTGAAFSFLHAASGWQNLFLGSLALIVSGIILYYLTKLSFRDYWANIALCFIMGGALGNAWDRVLFGHVIDFFDFHLGHWHFAIFNVADSAICVGAFMLLIHWLKYSDR